MKQLLEYDCHSSSEEYMDYVYHFALDEDELGGFIQVTLEDEPGQTPSASLRICVNNSEGDELIEQSFPIDRQTAYRMIAVHHNKGEIYDPCRA